MKPKTIQVIGLPGSGKSTAIRSFLCSSREIRYLDLATYVGPSRHHLFKRDIYYSKQNTIAESACGVALPGTYVVRLDVPIMEVYRNLEERDGLFDEDYLSLTEQFAIRANQVVSSSVELQLLLREFLGVNNEGKCSATF